MQSNSVQPCAVKFWTFAVPVFAGNIAVLATGALARHFYKEEPQTTRQTATMFAKFSTFWLVAGLTWIAMNKRNGITK
jgi:hypothetical protein